MKIVIVGAKRTAIGTFLGSLKNTSAVELGTVVAMSVLWDLPKEEIADVIVGNVLQAGAGMNPARQIALGAGLPSHVPGQTINRVCGSGMQSIVSAIQAIKARDGSLYLAGGIESMSRAPFLLSEGRSGLRLGTVPLLDSVLNDGLTDAFRNVHMGMTAENVASCWNISRAEQDAIAVESHRRAAAAIARDSFRDEIAAIVLPTRNGSVEFRQDEHVRKDTTIEALSKLKPAFKKPDGTVTAGNSSGINDGAAMVALTTEEFAKERGLPILAEILGSAVIGVDPAFMGIGPVTAIPMALKKTGLGIADIDLFEINEAFAATSLAVMRNLNLDPEKVNADGGAVALGHPIGASGARVVVTLIHALHRRKKEHGVASLCIGGGMGIAIAIRAV